MIDYIVRTEKNTTFHTSLEDAEEKKAALKMLGIDAIILKRSVCLQVLEV